MFWADPVLRGREPSLPIRLRRYEESIPQCMLYGCEGWAVTKSMSLRLRGVEGAMLRRICKFHRRPGETLSGLHEEGD